MRELLQEVRNYGGGTLDVKAAAGYFDEMFPLFFQLPILNKCYKCPDSRQAQSAIKAVVTFFKGEETRGYALLSWMLIHHLGAVVDSENRATQSRAGFDEWLLGKILEQNFYDLGISSEQVQQYLLLSKILTSHQNWWKNSAMKKESLNDVLQT